MVDPDRSNGRALGAVKNRTDKRTTKREQRRGSWIRMSFRSVKPSRREALARLCTIPDTWPVNATEHTLEPS